MIQAKTRGIQESAIIRQLHQKAHDSMAISTQEGLVVIRFSDINYCEAMSNYCRIHLREGLPVLASKALKQVMAVLPPGDFVRIHQSYVVRFDGIASAGHEVRLMNGDVLPVSRSQRNALMQLIRNRMPVV